MRLRIATWNTWKNEGAYRLRLHAMAEALCALSADVVLLQECFRVSSEEGDAADTCAWLAEATRLRPVYAPARRKHRELEGRERDSESGHAVLTRWPVLNTERLVLPTTERGGERIALLVRVRTPGGSLLLACVHFSHVRGEREVRRQQFECVMSRLSEIAAPQEPVFIGGDFNCARGDAEWESAAVPAGWRLCDAVDERGVSQPTHPVPVIAASRRIDFVLGMIRRDALNPNTVMPAKPAPEFVCRGAGIQFSLAIPPAVGAARLDSRPRLRGDKLSYRGNDDLLRNLPSDHALVWTDWDIADAR